MKKEIKKKTKTLVDLEERVEMLEKEKGYEMMSFNWEIKENQNNTG